MRLRDRLRVCRRDGAQRDHWQIDIVECGPSVSHWFEVRHLLLGTEYPPQWLECDGYWVELPRRFEPYDRADVTPSVATFYLLHAARRDAIATVAAIDGRVQPKAWLTYGDGAICRTGKARHVTVVWTDEARQTDFVPGGRRRKDGRPGAGERRRTRGGRACQEQRTALTEDHVVPFLERLRRAGSRWGGRRMAREDVSPRGSGMAPG